MKIKTSELSGMALCYVVCKLEMPHLTWGNDIGEHEHSKQIVVPELAEPFCYSPFTSWAMFGPIIEREKIDVDFMRGDMEWKACWFGPEEYNTSYGSTPLEAAMRCYVASKLGDEVEVPEELV